MIKLDDTLLAELGLSTLPPEEKKRLLAHIYETLEMRVGVELAKQMIEAQLMEFEQFIKSNDEAGALKWLETNFPHYKDVVAAEFEKLKVEVRQAAPQILAQTQQQQMQQQMPPQPMQQPIQQGYAVPQSQAPAGYPGAPQTAYPNPGYPPVQQQPAYPQSQQQYPYPQQQPVQQPQPPVQGGYPQAL